MPPFEPAGRLVPFGFISHIPTYHTPVKRGFWWFYKLAVVLLVAAVVGSHGMGGWLKASTVSALRHTPAVLIPVGGGNSSQLQAVINNWAAANPGPQWGVAVEQLDGGGAAATYQAQQQFYPASLYKLLLLQSLFQKTPYANWNTSVGGQSLAACVDKMIRLSDNDCGQAVGDYLGWTKVTAQLKTAGLSGTTLSTSDDQLHTTAADISLYLKQFYQLNSYPQAKSAVMNAMSQQVYRQGIPAGSAGCTVYDKIGDLNGYLHDAGIVQCTHSTYSLVILSKGGNFGQMADLASQLKAYLDR